MHFADQKLLSQLLDEHGARLVLYAQQWSGSPEDVVQEAFIQLMQQRPLPHNVVPVGSTESFATEQSARRAAARRVRHETTAAGHREPWFKPSAGRSDGRKHGRGRTRIARDR